jgi:hypothetical protein
MVYSGFSSGYWRDNLSLIFIEISILVATGPYLAGDRQAYMAPGRGYLSDISEKFL